MFKNVILCTLGLVVLVLGWAFLRNMTGLSMGFLQGKTVVLKRGDLTIPITASGSVEPKDRIMLKSEAAGKVSQIRFEVGEMVHAGDLLIKLDPADEQRMVDISEKASKQAEINLQKAKNVLESRKNSALPLAEARLAQTEEELKYAKWQYDRELAFVEQGGSVEPSEEQLLRIETAYKTKQAQLDAAKAEVENARVNIKLAEDDVAQAELAVERAKDDLADAQERLEETQIIAPTDGMIANLLVKEGEVIASGSMSLTGGTPLATLADISEFYVRALVDEADIGRVREIAPYEARPGLNGNIGDDTEAQVEPPPVDLGTPVKVTVEAFPDEVFEGVIDLIEPEPEQGRVIIQYVVRIRLTSANSNKLLLGMQANIEFVSESVSDVVLVPNEAVRIVDNEKGVYVPVPSQNNPGTQVPQFKPFRAGLDNGMFTQVVDGLDAGTVVYVKLPRKIRGGEVTGEDE